MCLTIPKKVVEISGITIVVETPSGDRQTVKTIVELNVGDYVLTQQNVAVEKIDEEYARELVDILKGGKSYA